MKNALTVLALFLLQAVVPVAGIRAETAPATSETEVEAKIILNLPLVATWPGSALPSGEKVRLCTLSEGEVSLYLQALASQPEYSENIQFLPNVAQDALASCHVLFLDRQDAPVLGQVLGAIAGAPVLTVGTTEKFARSGGGMIGFLHTEKKIGLFSEKNVRFEINLKHTATVGITLDPLLLELAENIISDKGGVK